MTLPDPMELEPPDPPEEGHDKPYWLRETKGDRRLILHDADGTILGWVERYEKTPYYVAMIGSDTSLKRYQTPWIGGVSWDEKRARVELICAVIKRVITPPLREDESCPF